jgi:Saxitoxin biosynthesis operon protein SxtJ
MASQDDLHESLSRAEELRPPSERAFGITLAVALFILTVLFALRGSDVWLALLALALLLSAVTAIAPGRLRPLNRLWMRFGMVLHAIISPIVLFILFFAVITPTGLLARLFGKDFLRLKFDTSAPTYWIDRRPPGPRPESLRNQF